MIAYQPRIAIVGGGPSGLTVGVLLHKHKIPFTVFELRSKPTAEDLAQPVGMLDLHEESGLAAIKACDLLDEFNSHTGVCSENQVIATRDGEIIYTDEGGPESRPEISRNSLSQILLERLPPQTIKWEHKLSSATRTTTAAGATEVELDFGSNGKHTFDLVIGADGTWSRVRKLLTDTKPQYAGIQLITVTIREVTKKYPEIAEYVNTGTFTSLGLRNGVMSQRGLQDSARIYICVTTPDANLGSTLGITNGTPAEAKDILMNDDALFGRFGPKLKELIAVACDEETRDNPDTKITVYPLHQLPFGHSWPHQTGVTVIGDASHVMCPWAAEGVNLAMWDGLDLANAIIKACETSPQNAVAFQESLDPLVQEFEKDMSVRAKDKAEEADQNGKMMFGSEDGATAMAGWMRQAMAMAMAGEGGHPGSEPAKAPLGDLN